MGVASKELKELIYGTDAAECDVTVQATPKKRGRPKSCTIVAAPDTSVYIRSKNRSPNCDCIKVTPRAAAILEALYKETGQSKRYLASELICQGAKFISFYPAACSHCEDLADCDASDPYQCCRITD